MKKLIYSTIIFLIGFEFSYAASIIHYDIDFEQPTHTNNSPPSTNNGLNTISRIIAGTPTVLSNHGEITSQSLVLNVDQFTREQVELDLGLGFDNYQISFDVETNHLVDSLYSFSIFFDTPEIRNISLHGDNGIRTFNPSLAPLLRSRFIGDFEDNSIINFNIDVNLTDNIWAINSGIYPIFTSQFNSQNGDIESLRFSLSPRDLSAGLEPNVSVAIDNIVITSVVVPLPSSILLLIVPLLSILKYKNNTFLQLTNHSTWTR